MRKFLTALAIATVSFAAGPAMAENAVTDSQARLAKLWNAEQTKKIAIGQTPRKNLAGMRATDRGTGTWADSLRGGRGNPPAGH